MDYIDFGVRWRTPKYVRIASTRVKQQSAFTFIFICSCYISDMAQGSGMLGSTARCCEGLDRFADDLGTRGRPAGGRKYGPLEVAVLTIARPHWGRSRVCGTGAALGQRWGRTGRHRAPVVSMPRAAASSCFRARVRSSHARRNLRELNGPY